MPAKQTEFQKKPSLTNGVIASSTRKQLPIQKIIFKDSSAADINFVSNHALNRDNSFEQQRLTGG